MDYFGINPIIDYSMAHATAQTRSQVSASVLKMSLNMESDLTMQLLSGLSGASAVQQAALPHLGQNLDMYV